MFINVYLVALIQCFVLQNSFRGCQLAGGSSDHIKPDARSMRESGIPAKRAKTDSRDGQAFRSSIVCSIVISFFPIDKPRFSELVSQEQRYLIAT
jgi:hypothetical protein